MTPAELTEQREATMYVSYKDSIAYISAFTSSEDALCRLLAWQFAFPLEKVQKDVQEARAKFQESVLL